jgi:hypothetical protein
LTSPVAVLYFRLFEAMVERDDETVEEHPRGTLAIVLIYALLFALGWLLLYYGEFLPRG